MKTLQLFVFAAICTLLTSCAGLTQITVPQSTINYVGGDMETQRFVEYTLTKTYILGIGGMSHKARNTNIIDELMKKADLQQNESLAYISVSRNINTYLGVITDVKFTASGYVVRPVNGEYDEREIVNAGERAQKQLYNNYKRQINNAITGDALIQIKKAIEKEVSVGSLSESLAKDLYIKISNELNR